MPTAFTGSLGWTGLHPIQLGGPPLVNTFDRKLPPTLPPQVGAESAARPFIGHVYQNDGVNALGTFTVLNRPVLAPILANGSFNQILLEVAAFATGTIYGIPIYGTPLYGGTSINVSQGNVVRLSEQGGDGSFVYGGVVEDIPETIGPSGVRHQILVSPFAVELDDSFSQAVYSAPVDVSQLVRDAVALTRHCSCDQVSCPASTGILAATSGQLDFRNQAVKSIIDHARSIAGPTWYWHVDELGRVWFQPMGSGAVYTIPMAQYEERTKSASIQDRKNKVVAVGGVPVNGSANITAVADDVASQGAIGIRALNPPLQVPNITDQPSLTLIAATILAVLNRTWQRVTLKVLATYGRRIHASQPGGAMVRYWEPAVNPMQESSVGAGYSGTFIAQSLSNDGLHQHLTAGDIPVTSQNDVDNMVKSLVARVAANSLQVTAAALNLLGQVMSGSLRLGSAGGIQISGVTGNLSSGTQTLVGLNSTPATLWQLTQTEFEAIDPNGVIRAEMGNLPANGISPAQWGMRANRADGNPIFDSAGLIDVIASLGLGNANANQSFTSATFSAVTNGSVSFSLSRQSNIRVDFVGTGNVSTNNGNVGFLRANLVGVTTSGNENFGVLANFAQTSSGWLWIANLAAGSYTLELDAAVNATPQTFLLIQATSQVFRVGS